MPNEIQSPTYKAFKDANAGATVSKTFYVMNGMVVLAINSADAAVDNVFAYESENVKVAKAAGVWTVGQEIFYNAAAANFTTVAAGMAFAGYVVADAANGDTEGHIYLTPNKVDRGVPADVGFVVGAEVANAITVSLQLKDKVGAALANRGSVQAYLSSDANGDSVAAFSVTLTITGGANGVTMPASAANSLGHSLLMLVSEAAGTIDVVVTETAAATNHYLAVVLPNGKLVVSTVLAFA